MDESFLSFPRRLFGKQEVLWKLRGLSLQTMVEATSTGFAKSRTNQRKSAFRTCQWNSMVMISTSSIVQILTRCRLIILQVQFSHLVTRTIARQFQPPGSALARSRKAE